MLAVIGVWVSVITVRDNSVVVFNLVDLLAVVILGANCSQEQSVLMPASVNEGLAAGESY